MASVVQTVLAADGGSGAGQTGTSIVFDSTHNGFALSALTAGNTVVGLVMWSTASDVTPTMHDNASTQNTFTVVNKQYDVGATNGAAMFYKVNITGGGTSITVSFGATTASFVSMELLEISGIASFDQSNSANASGSPASSPTITPAQSGEFLYGCIADLNGGATNTYAFQTPFTVLGNNGGSHGGCSIADESVTYNSVAGVTASFTTNQTGDGHFVGIAAFIGATASGLPPGDWIMLAG